MEFMRFSQIRRGLPLILGGFFIFFWVGSFFAPWPWMRWPQKVQHIFVEAGTLVFQRSQWWSKASIITPEELATLEAQRDAYAVGYAQSLLLEEENVQLRELLNFLDRQPYDYVTGSVISRSIASTSTTFVIDRGSVDGLYMGAPVITGQGMYVGKIIALTPTTATISPLTNTTSATAVSLLNETRTIGIAQGEGNQVVMIHYIPQNEQVEAEEMVVTSGLESSVPSGLFVGIITEVRGETSAPFQEAIVEPWVDARMVRFVSVLLLKEGI